MSDLTTNEPTKQCRKCNRLLPATTEYFHNRPDSASGLRNNCKDCKRAADIAKRLSPRPPSPPRENMPGFKQCFKCKKSFPLTTEYFCRHSGQKSGFNPRCKECMREKRRQENPERTAKEEKRASGFSQCTRCKKEFPYTSEYFGVDKRGKSGLTAACRTCNYQISKESADPVRSRETKRRYAESHRAERLKTVKEYVARNREKVRERQRLARRTPAYMEKARQWRINNAEKIRLTTQRYKARKASFPDDLTPKQWQAAIDYFDGCCAYCGREPGWFQTLCVEHFIPISSPDCTGTTITNVLPACFGPDGCNNFKGDKDPEAWVLSHFGKAKGAKILKRIREYFDSVRLS